MAPLRLTHVIGARPQFIKYAPVQRAIDALPPGAVENAVVHTGQHYDYRMSQVFFDDLGIRVPDVHLEVGSGPHGRQTALVLERLETALLAARPDVLVVYGDTNSTLGAALAGAKLHVPIAHVEAGLRSYRKQMPEEQNRVLTDHLSTWLFCPSVRAVENLAREGFAETAGPAAAGADSPAVVLVGDVMHDALLHGVAMADQRSTILDTLGLGARGYTLLTIHRAENTGADTLAAVVDFVNTATSGEVILPMHPRLEAAYAACPVRFAARVRTIPPLGYFDLLKLLQSAREVFTDSGGLQKEAYWLQVPCVTLRDETEWTETVASGWNTLYRDYPDDRHRAPAADAYGHPGAAEAIVSTLRQWHRHPISAGQTN
jgi:UDP-GlcNAc3NAcA epimerase